MAESLSSFKKKKPAVYQNHQLHPKQVGQNLGLGPTTGFQSPRWLQHIAELRSTAL